MNVSLIISSTFAPEYDDTYDVTGDLQNRPEISDEREWNAVANDGLEDGPKAVGESKGGVRLRRPPLGWTDGQTDGTTSSWSSLGRRGSAVSDPPLLFG